MSGDRYFIKDQNVPHFLTFTIIDWLKVLKPISYKQIIIDSMNYCVEKKGLIIRSWVIMHNHMHVIWQAKDKYRLSDIIRDFKKFTAKAIINRLQEEEGCHSDWALASFYNKAQMINRISKYKVWYDSNHAICLGPNDTALKIQKLNYIHENPVKGGIVESPEDYVYSSARDYAGEDGLVKIVLL